MDELISRQAVKELAHNQVREKYCGAALKDKEHRDFYIKLADSIIDLLPSAQPEIVRCKDCKHYEHGICKKAGLCINKSPNGFCDWGDRREVTT